MSKDYKLRGAEYFLKQMEVNESNEEIFMFYLDAFLSSSISVLYYICDELRIPKLKRKYCKECFTEDNHKIKLIWCKSLKNKYDTFKLFWDIRNITIHVKPVSLKDNVMVQHQEILTVVPVEVKAKLIHIDDLNNETEEYIWNKSDLNQSNNDNKVSTYTNKSRNNHNRVSQIEARTMASFQYFFTDYNSSSKYKDNNVDKEVISYCKEFLEQLYDAVEEGRYLKYIS